MTGWEPILAAAHRERLIFGQAWREPQVTQLTLLRTLLAENAATAFGRAHGFEQIDSIETFRARVPVRDYEGLRPFIDRAVAGEAAVLTRAPLIACEETGGTTSGRKLIPYTTASLAAFRAAVLPWLGDLARQRPQTFAGRAYVAVSPVARPQCLTAGGIPVGLPGEGAYLGEDLAACIASVLAVPAAVGRICDIADWRFATLVHLLAAADLTFISIWSPTFLIGLIEALPMLAEPLLEATAGDPARARLMSVALSRRPVDTQLLWPQLATVSAWADGASTSYARRLRELLPHAELQPKGLLATEGAVTIPWQGSSHCVPAVTSAFLEFIDHEGRSWLCDELMEGATYRVVMTTPGGLYRYDLGDRVLCRGHTGELPRLEFVGRAGVATDIVGEKLGDEFVTAALRGIDAPACLAARATETPCYELMVDAAPGADVGLLAAQIEQRLHANPQYAYARALGQLGPVAPRRVVNLLDRYMRAEAQQGRRLADIKPPTLIADAAVYAALIAPGDDQGSRVHDDAMYAREDRSAELLRGGVS